MKNNKKRITNAFILANTAATGIASAANTAGTGFSDLLEKPGNVGNFLIKKVVQNLTISVAQQLHVWKILIYI